MAEHAPETTERPVVAQNEPGVQMAAAERPVVAQNAPTGQRTCDDDDEPAGQ